MTNDSPSGERQDTSLSQVRELLFGAHQRTVEHELGTLREQLRNEVNQLKENLNEQIQTIRSQMEADFHSVHERMNHSSAEQGGAIQSLTDSLATRAADLESRLDHSEQELRRHTLNETKNLWDDVRVRYDDLSRHVQDELDKLKAASARRASLSEMFREFADRLDQNPE